MFSASKVSGANRCWMPPACQPRDVSVVAYGAHALKHAPRGVYVIRHVETGDRYFARVIDEGDGVTSYRFLGGV